MDKTTTRLTNIASIVVIIAFGLVLVFKVLNEKQKNNIVVKTDLYEKYILRDSSLTSYDFSKEDLLKLYEEEKKPVIQKINNIKESLNKLIDRPELFISKDLSRKLVSENYKVSEINNLIEIIKNEKELVFYKGIKFRPIFEDLNGQKNILAYEKIACLNKKLGNDSIELLDKKTGIISEKFNNYDGFLLSKGYVVPINDFSAINNLKINICNKYAKF